MSMDRILLIHPNPKARDQLTFLLQHSGFQVLIAVNAEQAMDKISRRVPDVIIMAEPLARSNGDDPCMRIRQKCEKTAFIILGEYEHESAGIHLLNSGADTYLPSPLDSRLLLAWVRSLLRRYKGDLKKVHSGESLGNETSERRNK